MSSRGIVPYVEMAGTPLGRRPLHIADEDRAALNRVGRYLITRDDVWVTLYDEQRRQKCWTRRFDRHSRILWEHGDTLLVLGLRDDELRLFEVSVETGQETEKRRLGFGAYDLAHNVVVLDGMAFLVGPRRVVGIDLARGDIAWERPLRADKILPLALSGCELFVAHTCDSRTGVETTLSRIERESGAIEDRMRMAADCHGLLANDHAVFARLEAGHGRIPFGRHGIAAFRADGRGEPLLLPGSGAVVAKGRYFLMEDGHRADLIVTTDDGLVASTGMLPTKSTRGLRIAGTSAYLEAERTCFAIDLERFSTQLAVPRCDLPSALIVAAFEPEEPPPGSGVRGLLRPLLSSSADPRATALATTDLARFSALFQRLLVLQQDPTLWWRLQTLGLTVMRPWGRWFPRAGRDPSLLDFAQLADGDHLCFYDYPAHPGALPVVKLPAASRRLQYLAPDFDTFFSGYLAEQSEIRPGLVEVVSELLGASVERVEVSPPAWFQEAHETPGASWAAVEEARRAGDHRRAERLLVALAIEAGAAELEAIQGALATLYATLGWSFQERAVKETWNIETRG
jgi:hypothetical protein